MHHCLEITEILVKICEHCENDLPAGRTLLSFALACKYFLEPSLDILWRDQKNLIKLVKTFPADAWHQSRPPPGIVSFSQTPTKKVPVLMISTSTLSVIYPSVTCI